MSFRHEKSRILDHWLQMSDRWAANGEFDIQGGFFISSAFDTITIYIMFELLMVNLSFVVISVHLFRGVEVSGLILHNTL